MSRYPSPHHPGLVPVPAGRIRPAADCPEEHRVYPPGRDYPWDVPSWWRRADCYAVAGKRHWCAACAQPILRGELHWRVTYGPWEGHWYEGDIWTCRMCEWCGPRVHDILDADWYEYEITDALDDLQERWLDRLAQDGLLARDEDGTWDDVRDDLRGQQHRDTREWMTMEETT